MIANIEHTTGTIKVDLSKPIDISMPLRAGENNANAWYRPPVTMEPVRMGDWVGDVNLGGSVNFRDIWFNPHAHGTHTECVGHISKEFYSVNQSLVQFFFLAQLVTITPDEYENDKIITAEHLMSALHNTRCEAVVLRTLPNDDSKLVRQYSNSNPPFLHHLAATWLRSKNIQHLLLDLPSVDKEQDEGKLLAHHAFWHYPESTRMEATITELIYVPDSIADGEYLLNLQMAPFENDASPSKPVLYKII